MVNIIACNEDYDYLIMNISSLPTIDHIHVKINLIPNGQGNFEVDYETPK